MQNLPRLVGLIVGRQGLGFDQVQLDRVIRLLVAFRSQTALGFGGLAVVDQNVGLAQLRRQIVIAGADLGVLDQCALWVVALFSYTTEVQVRRIDVAFPGDQVFQITLGLVPGLGFQAHQRQGITQFVVFRVLLDQA